MPEGQFTGSRGKYVYATDTGKNYILTLDTTLATLAGTGLVAFDPENPGTATPAPRRFKPRVVFWQGTTGAFLGKRKALVCGSVTAALYATESGGALTVDGAAGKTTGRRGEKLTF